MKKLLLLLIGFFSPLLADAPLKGVSEFGWDYFQAASQSTSGKNTVFSPYSIYSCLAMTSAGAEGNTMKAMQKVLHSTADLGKTSDALSAFQAKFDHQMTVANSLWLAPQFFILADFRQTIEKDFHASIQSLDFSNPAAAASTINQWVATQTQQKINYLIGPNDLQTLTRLVLTNALYFSGQFLKPFDAKLTQSKPFWINDDTAVDVDTMEQTATLLYGEDDAFQTVVLSFKKSTIGLVICLPKEKTFKGIAPELGAEKFEIVLEGLSSQMVHLQLPKFTIKELSNMNSLLSQLGLSIAFSREADFSKIDGKHDLFLSKALHAALIAVDENGVVAAAASAASMNVKSMPNQKPPAEFNADHPFVFALIDLQTKTPLFLGELANPQ